MSSAPVERPPSPAAAVAAAGLMSAQAVIMLGVAVFDLSQVGSDAQPSRAVASSVVIILLAACVGALGFVLLRQPLRARTGTVVWNLVLIPVGIDLVQAKQALLGFGVLALAVATAVAAVLAARVPGSDRTG